MLDRVARRALLLVAANPDRPLADIAAAARLPVDQLQALRASPAGQRFVRAMAREPALLDGLRLTGARAAPEPQPEVGQIDETRLPEHLESILARAYQVVP